MKFLDVSKAYDTAREYQTSCLLKLKALYREELDSRSGIHVVLLGRPYTALSKTMNKSIPDIFASLGIRVYYQDMLPYSHEETEPIQELLRRIHWRYAAEILTAAQVTATSERTPIRF